MLLGWSAMCNEIRKVWEGWQSIRRKSSRMWLRSQTTPHTRIWSFLKTTMHFLCITSHCSSLSYSLFSTQTSRGCGCIYTLCLLFRFRTSLLVLSSSLASRQPRTHSARLVASWPYHHRSTLQHGCVTKWSSLMERKLPVTRHGDFCWLFDWMLQMSMGKSIPNLKSYM